MKKKWYKSWWAIIIYIIAGFIILGSILPEPEEKSAQLFTKETPPLQTEEAGEEGTEEKSEISTVIPGTQQETQPETQPEIKTHLVTRVVDGDTIEIEGGLKVRYIGIVRKHFPNIFSSHL